MCSTIGASPDRQHSTTKRYVGALAVAFAVLLCEPAGAERVEHTGPAKKQQVQIETTPLELAPRTIEDITAVLEESRDIGKSTLEKAQRTARREPPKTDNRSKLARFYFDRAQANRALGRSKAEIADYRLAGKYASGKRLWRTHMEMSWTEWRVGNWSRAEEEVGKACQKPWKGDTHKLWRCTAEVAWHRVLAGDIAGAEEKWVEAERIWSRIDFSNWRPQGRANFKADRDHYRATILLAQGKSSEAERLIRGAIRKFYPHRRKLYQDPGYVVQADQSARLYTWHLRDLSAVLRREGRLAEAEVVAREALLEALRATGRDSDHASQCIEELTIVLLEQGRYADAETLARINLDIYQKVGAPPDSYMIAKMRTRIADVLTARGLWAEASAEFETAGEGMSKDAVYQERLLIDNLNWPLALLRSGNVSEALAKFESTYNKRKNSLGNKHYETAEARGFLAMAYAAAGKPGIALGHFREAVPVLLQRSRRSDSERVSRSMQQQRLSLILNAYIHLLVGVAGSGVEKEAGIDALEEAFRMADEARTGSVHQALSESAARAALRDPKLAEVARREQDAVKQIGALYGALSQQMSLVAEERDERAIRVLRKRIDGLTATGSKLMEEIERHSPEYAALLNPRAPGYEALRSSLRPDEAVLAYYVGDDATHLWAIPKQGEVAFATASIGREKLTQWVRRLRDGLDPSDAETLGDIPEFDVATAFELFELLLEPTATGWRNAKTLLLITHGPLAELPFSVLPTGAAALKPERAPFFSRYRKVPWLIRDYAIATLPSGATLMALRALPKSELARDSYAGFGDPVFSREQESNVEAEQLAAGSIQSRALKRRSKPNTRAISSADLSMLPPLPDTAEEVQNIARALGADPKGDVFLGADASEERVMTTPLSNRRVVVFATHGLVPGDLDGLLEPALALSSPAVTGESGDGVLTTSEILGLKLNADWVVLSACNTAAAGGAGAEAVSGLGRAFFYAGARSLLVTQWPVETTSAKALTTGVFGRQSASPSLSRSEALQQSMVNLIDGPGYVDPSSGKALFSYAHPLFWAPFALVGDGAN